MGSRVAVVDDHGLIAHTLATALSANGVLVSVIDPLASGDLVSAVRAVEPTLLLLDLDLGDGGDATDLIPVLAEETTVVMVTGVTDAVRQARCVRAGAVGIVDKSSSFDQLLAAVGQALRDGTLLTAHEREEHLALLRKHEAEQEERLAPFAALTPREAEVLGALMRGESVEQIAKRAVVSLATVRTQVRAILSKLGVSSQLAATARAHEAGWQWQSPR